MPWQTEQEIMMRNDLVADTDKGAASLQGDSSKEMLIAPHLTHP